MIKFKAMLHYFNNSFVFLGSMVISALIVYPFTGIQGGIGWTSFAVLCTYLLYNAKPDQSNFYYIIFWIIVIMSSAYIGRFLHLSFGFYLYLLVIAYCYYFFLGKDPVFNRAIRFIIILSTMSTAMPEITYQLPIGATIGTLTALAVCHYMMRKKHDLEAFKQGVFARNLITVDTHLIPRAIIFSLGMFMCLLIPQYLGIEKNYWATLTFLVVMTPKTSEVAKNTFFRFLGSVAAIAVLYLIFKFISVTYIPLSMPQIVLIMLAIFAFILPLCFGKHVVIIAFGVTCYSLTLIELVGYWQNPTYEILIARIEETLIGGAMAIITSIILGMIRYKDEQHAESTNDPRD